MKYYKINAYDATNWDGINTTIFFTGCNFGCPGCFNESIQDFSIGEDLTENRIQEFINFAKSKHVTGVCILGGEPFQQNIDDLFDFINRVKREVGKPIHIWTGFTYESIIRHSDKKEILGLIDTLVDGLFVQSLKDLNLKYRGSSNQRVIDVKKSLIENDIILY